jgi:excisionase family DNA binding protein
MVVFKGMPRSGLRTKEAAEFTGVGYRDILAMIHAGRIRVITGGRSYVIPVGELDEILAWAELAEFQCGMRRLTGRRGPKCEQRHTHVPSRAK